MGNRNKLRRSLDGSATIDAFVRKKTQRLIEAGRADGGLRFDRLFEFMFSEGENVMLEYSRGFQIHRVTYGECRKRILALAGGLGERLRAYGPDAVVGLYMDNSREWIETFWAILLCGCRPLLMNLRLAPEQLDDALKETGAVLVLADGERAGTGFSVPSAVPEFPEEPAAEPRVQGAGRPAGTEILLMSSGTSSRVKICAYTADAFQAMIEDSCQIIRSCPQIKKHYHGCLKQLAFLPFYHIFGLVAVYFWFAFFSRTFVLLANMAPETIVNTIRRHEVTHVFAVPMLWDKTCDQVMRAIRDRGEGTLKRFGKGMRIAAATEGVPGLNRLVSKVLFREIRSNLFGNSIRFMISGGSEIRPAVLEFMNRVGYHIANGYGMTEIGITSVELDRRARVRNSASVGRPFSSVAYRTDEKGQLLVKSRGMACRIRCGAEELGAAGDWFATGDLAEERGGNWYILGRMDDLVVSPTGENLNPQMVEKQLETPEIQELCLIGVPGENGVRPVLVARPRMVLDGDGAERARAALRERLRETGLDKQISQVALVREPLVPADEIKLNRTRVRKSYMENAYTELTAENAAGGSSALRDRIREVFAASLNRPAEEITDDADFFLDGGGSSLDYFDMASKLQDEYGIPFPVENGKSLNTVADLARYVEKKVDGRG